MSRSSQHLSTTTRLVSVLVLLCVTLTSSLAPASAAISFLSPEKNQAFQKQVGTRSSIEFDAVWQASSSCMGGSGAILELWRLHADGQYYFVQIVSALVDVRRQEGALHLGEVTRTTQITFNDVRNHFDDDLLSLRVVYSNCARFSATFRAILRIDGQIQRPPLSETDKITQPEPQGDNSGHPNVIVPPAADDGASARSTIKVLLAIFIPIVLICSIVLLVQRFQVKSVSLLGSESAFDDDIRRLAEAGEHQLESGAAGNVSGAAAGGDYDPDAVAAAM